jgi:hypothetical protein
MYVCFVYVILFTGYCGLCVGVVRRRIPTIGEGDRVGEVGGRGRLRERVIFSEISLGEDSVLRFKILKDEFVVF